MSMSCEDVVAYVIAEKYKKKGFKCEWSIICPKNYKYVKENKLDIELKFMRTIYIPY